MTTRITIYFSADYAVARTKLKLAEQLSDVNTCSDPEEYLKKSRKFRTAKHESSSYDNSEDSDETIISSLPKPPCKQTDINRGISTKKRFTIRNVKV